MADINVTGLGGFLMAKCAAAYSRRKPKDWYDIAYVLLHNDAGGVEAAAQIVLTRFGSRLTSVRTALDDLRDNFADVAAQGAVANADEMSANYRTSTVGRCLPTASRPWARSTRS